MNSPIAISLDGRAAAQDADSLLLVPSLERRRLQCYAGLVLADVVALLSGVWLAGYIYLGPAAVGAADSRTGSMAM